MKKKHKNNKSVNDNNVNMINPEYLEEFKCIGGSCSDSCCTGWDIEIDKKTFRDYYRVKDENMKRMFQKYVHNNPDYTNENLDYGKIKLPKDKRCPFLDEENYCIIFKNIGEEYLSCVCTHFPRVLNKVDEHFEMSLDLSCPEASRIILNLKEGIKFKKYSKKLNKHIMSGILDTKNKEFKDTLVKYFNEMRDTSINIIQNRKYSLSKRLYALGVFLSTIDDLYEEDLQKVSSFIKNFKIENYAKEYERDTMNYVIQVSFLKNIVDSLNIVNEIDSITFKEHTKEALSGFNLKSPNDLQNNVSDYINAFNKYEEEYFHKYDYIFENYLVNSIYNNLFPFSESDYIFDGYIMLLLRYSLIRFYLVGKFIKRKKDSKDDIIAFIQVFVKAVEHDKNYRMEILEYIKDNDFDNIEFAKTLI